MRQAWLGSHTRGRPDMSHTLGRPGWAYTYGAGLAGLTSWAHMCDMSHTQGRPDISHTWGRPGWAHTRGWPGWALTHTGQAWLGARRFCESLELAPDLPAPYMNVVNLIFRFFKCPFSTPIHCDRNRAVDATQCSGW